MWWGLEDEEKETSQRNKVLVVTMFWVLIVNL